MSKVFDKQIDRTFPYHLRLFDFETPRLGQYWQQHQEEGVKSEDFAWQLIVVPFNSLSNPKSLALVFAAFPIARGNCISAISSFVHVNTGPSTFAGSAAAYAAQLAASFDIFPPSASHRTNANVAANRSDGVLNVLLLSTVPSSSGQTLTPHFNPGVPTQAEKGT